MFKETSLESHLYSSFKYLEVLTNQFNNIIKSDLVLAYIIDDIFIIKKFYIANICKEMGNAHRKDILEPVLQDRP